ARAESAFISALLALEGTGCDKIVSCDTRDNQQSYSQNAMGDLAVPLIAIAQLYVGLSAGYYPNSTSPLLTPEKRECRNAGLFRLQGFNVTREVVDPLIDLCRTAH